MFAHIYACTECSLRTGTERKAHTKCTHIEHRNIMQIQKRHVSKGGGTEWCIEKKRGGTER